MFRTGDTVVFDPDSFNSNFWYELSQEDRLKYYGPLGYGQSTIKLFTFICEMHPQHGHCVLIALDDGRVEVMRHTADFRLATENEC